VGSSTPLYRLPQAKLLLLDLLELGLDDVVLRLALAAGRPVAGLARRAAVAPAPPCPALAYMASASLWDARDSASVALFICAASFDSSAFFASASPLSTSPRAVASSDAPCSASVRSVW
jgi:hypothetical protein